METSQQTSGMASSSLYIDSEIQNYIVDAARQAFAEAVSEDTPHNTPRLVGSMTYEHFVRYLNDLLVGNNVPFTNWLNQREAWQFDERYGLPTTLKVCTGRKQKGTYEVNKKGIWTVNMVAENPHYLQSDLFANDIEYNVNHVEHWWVILEY